MEATSNNKRIARNTLLLYFRMILLMVISLYTSRVVIEVLGVIDFGIFNVVGGLVAMLGALNGSMAIAVQRYLSFEIGKGSEEGIKRIFSMSIIAHVIISLLVFILAETVGCWFLENKINIPADRYDAAMWVFHCVVVACLFTIVQIPYNAIILAKEKMGAFAYISILEVILKLGIAFMLLIGNLDKLKLYGILTAATTILVTIVYRVYCIKKFQEARFKFIWDKKIIKELTSFAGWSMMGQLAWAFTGQGVNIILNIFFGPSVNAARGLSEQVNGAVSRFISNFQMAVNPQLIKQYAADDLREMNILLFSSTRFSFYLLLSLSLPIIFEIDFILNVWLKEVPEYTAMFCRIVLINSLVMVLSNLLATVAQAYGRIRRYQTIVSIILFLNFPFSYLILYLGGSPQTSMYVYFVISVVLLFVRLLLTRPMIQLRIKEYFINVIIPVIKVSIISVIVPIFIYKIMEDTVLRFFILGSTSAILVVVSSYLFGITVKERLMISKLVYKIIKRNVK